jgi:prenylcysteine oxidase/farnesylcysteine lyase
LNKYATQDGLAINVTVFEKTDHIGGRTLTINPFGNESIHVELGASIFVELNAILYNATQEFGLETTNRWNGDDDDGFMSIWDGEKFVLEIDQSQPSWRIALQIVWKYGIQAPRRTNNLMKSTISKFLKLYELPSFPFESLSEKTYELGLLEATSLTGAEFLRKNKV